jgi:hypothetical protein
MDMATPSQFGLTALAAGILLAAAFGDFSM